MELNKLQLKARVFQLIEPLRKLSAIDDSLISSVLSCLKELEDVDFGFIARILIKEADHKNQKCATALLFIAENLAPEAFMALIMKELNSFNVSDSQKMFLINILSGLGIKIDPAEVGAYLLNPDEAINGETLRFLENAIIDPEAQIDFLDFYFSSSTEDKNELINSIMSDFEGDKLANIFSPLILSADDFDTINMCLDVLEKTKSLLMVKPLQYLICSNSNKDIAKRAAKILRKMEMAGVYNKKKLISFYKEILENFDEPVFYLSLPDGNSNFSLAVSRKTKDDAYFVLFTAINLNLGPFSCFGFSSITKTDHDTILSRFFSSAKQIKIPLNAGKKILNSYILKRIALKKIIPYELFCWERIVDDIEIIDKETDELFKEGLVEVEINDFSRKIINTSPFIQTWFYRVSKNNLVVSEFIDKICHLKKDEIEKSEILIEEFSLNEEIKANIKTRILFLAFCLKCGSYTDFANMYYSLLNNETELEYFISNVLKKSVYEYMLTLREETKKEKSVFRNIQNKETPFNEFIEYIEQNWTKG